MKLAFSVRAEEYASAMNVVIRTYKVLRRSPLTAVRSPADALLFILREWEKLLPALEEDK